MVNCPKCGRTNAVDTAFCTSCGISLHSEVGSTIEQQAKQFARTMEQAGKRVSENIAQAARQFHKGTQKEARSFEQRMGQMSRRAESWYETSVGPFGPLLESFIFLIVFRVVIMVMELPNDNPLQLRAVAAILLVYILPLFVLSLLSNYTQYLSKKFFSIRVFSPLFYAIFFVLLCWIISRILSDASIRFSMADLQNAAVSLEHSLPTIFVFFLLLGYVILMLNLPKEPRKKP